MANTTNQNPSSIIANQAQANTAPQTPQANQPQANTASQTPQATNQTGAPQAVIGLFSNLTTAEQAVNQLRSSGFTTEEINIISKNNEQTRYTNETVDDSIVDGTMTGGAIGGIGGLLMSAGALAIPGIGPIIAAGPLAATISGAVSGGIAGGLIDWGIPTEKSEEYSNHVSAGSTLAVIKTLENKVPQAVQILTATGATNIETHPAK